uniref:Uncharacterized protein n=1 Tax=Tetranychus urticae TaxID=32264 RepID=T1KIK6_TETUR
MIYWFGKKEQKRKPSNKNQRNNKHDSQSIKAIHNISVEESQYYFNVEIQKLQEYQLVLISSSRKQSNQDQEGKSVIRKDFTFLYLTRSYLKSHENQKTIIKLTNNNDNKMINLTKANKSVFFYFHRVTWYYPWWKDEDEDETRLGRRRRLSFPLIISIVLTCDSYDKSEQEMEMETDSKNDKSLSNSYYFDEKHPTTGKLLKLTKKPGKVTRNYIYTNGSHYIDMITDDIHIGHIMNSNHLLLKSIGQNFWLASSSSPSVFHSTLSLMVQK